MSKLPDPVELTRQRILRAGLLAQGALPARLSLTLSEALVIGLLRQGVKTFLSVLGHGSTEIGEVLRIYQQAGLLRVCGLRSEIEASHAAAALRWVTGEKAAVVTSIGPGALHALAASFPLRMASGSGICWAMRQPKMKASTCSRSRSTTRAASSGFSGRSAGRILYTPPFRFHRRSTAARRLWIILIARVPSFCSCP
jgi:hypothetical protein